MLHDRKGEAEACIQHSLNILRGYGASELFWQAAVNLGAQFAGEQGGDAAAVQMLERWMPVFPKELSARL